MKSKLIGSAFAAAALLFGPMTASAAAAPVVPVHQDWQGFHHPGWGDPHDPYHNDWHCDSRGLWHNDQNDQWGHWDDRCRPWQR